MTGRDLPRPVRRGLAGRFSVGGKFGTAIALLLCSVIGVAAVAVFFLAQTHRQADRLFSDNVQTLQQTADVAEALAAVENAALLRTTVAADRGRLDASLETTLVPRAQQSLSALRVLVVESPGDVDRVDQMSRGLSQYIELRHTALEGAAGNPAITARTATILGGALAIAEQLRTQESQSAGERQRANDDSYRTALYLLTGGVAASLALGLLIALLLRRDFVPRVRRYAGFATDIADGRDPASLRVTGRDELAELGNALNAMHSQRARTQTEELAQAEFVDSLQVTSSEEEAHQLIRRHLERSLPDSAAVVLQRNNSANRLQAATALATDNDLTGRLLGAQPRACLAVRFARPHREEPGHTPLVSCELCGMRTVSSTCEPLLVGGEVIGAVLLSHPEPLEDAEESRVRTSVAQAAPVLANLRNLALAEFRANSDSLTGLPNKRASDDTLKRMVAQASRSVTPLAAIMLDLDHFKQINDRYGHGKGDEVLAAVGAALESCLRDSDFAGRIGGEEFVVLLPDTGLDGAAHVAEKIRSTIAAVTVPGLDRAITVSLGVADLLRHAGNATSLLREADRALYAAKMGGRNRTVLATDSTDVAGTASSDRSLPSSPVSD